MTLPHWVKKRRHTGGGNRKKDTGARCSSWSCPKCQQPQRSIRFHCFHWKVKLRFSTNNTALLQDRILMKFSDPPLTRHSSMVPNLQNIIRISCSVSFLLIMPTNSFLSSHLFSESAGFICTQWCIWIRKKFERKWGNQLKNENNQFLKTRKLIIQNEIKLN